MKPLVRALSGMALVGLFAGNGVSLQAGLITEAIEVIEVASIGIPDELPEETDDVPALEDGAPGEFPRFATPGKLVAVAHIGTTGHGVGFGDSIVGGTPQAGKKAAGRGGSGAGGTGNTQGAGPGPGVGDPMGFSSTSTTGLGTDNSTTTEPNPSSLVVDEGSTPPGTESATTEPTDGTKGSTTGNGGTGSSTDPRVFHNPEPGSMTLLALGLVGFAGWNVRRGRKSN